MGSLDSTNVALLNAKNIKFNHLALQESDFPFMYLNEKATRDINMKNFPHPVYWKEGFSLAAKISSLILGFN